MSKLEYPIFGLYFRCTDGDEVLFLIERHRLGVEMS